MNLPKRLSFTLLIITFFSLLAACGTNAPTEGEMTASSSQHELPSSATKSSSYPEIISGQLGLTKAQMLEDYEYLWATLEQNCPFLNVASRKGVDLAAVKKKYYLQVCNVVSERYFYNSIEGCLAEFQDIAHINLLDVQFTYPYLKKSYLDISDPIYVATAITWMGMLTDPRTEDAYEKWNQVLNPLGTIASSSIKETQTSHNISITKEKQAVIIKIQGFPADTTPDYDQLLRTYQETEMDGVENLIFDLTENGGGSSTYWIKNIAEPLMTKDTNAEWYYLFPYTDYNRAFWKNDSYLESQLQPIADFNADPFPGLHPEDLSTITHFLKGTISFVPADVPAFTGNRWVLVGPRVFSASENFVQFCKQTGWATLVGTQTGGDGLGSEPLLLTLPNSCLMVRYSGVYGLNQDGSCNAEVGTTPDIISPSGETPLETCLRAIEETGN